MTHFPLNSFLDLIEKFAQDAAFAPHDALPISLLVQLQMRLLKCSKSLVACGNALQKQTSFPMAAFSTADLHVNDIETRSIERRIVANAQIAGEKAQETLQTSPQETASETSQPFVDAFATAFGDELDALRRGTAAFDHVKLNVMLASIGAIASSAYEDCEELEAVLQQSAPKMATQ